MSNANPWLVAFMIFVLIAVPLTVFYAIGQGGSQEVTPKTVHRPLAAVPARVFVPSKYALSLCGPNKIESVVHERIYRHNDANDTFTVGVQAYCSEKYQREELVGFVGAFPVYKLVWDTHYYLDEKVVWHDRGTDYDFTHNRSHRMLVGMR